MLRFRVKQDMRTSTVERPVDPPHLPRHRRAGIRLRPPPRGKEAFEMERMRRCEQCLKLPHRPARRISRDRRAEHLHCLQRFPGMCLL